MEEHKCSYNSQRNTLTSDRPNSRYPQLTSGVTSIPAGVCREHHQAADRTLCLLFKVLDAFHMPHKLEISLPNPSYHQNQVKGDVSVSLIEQQRNNKLIRSTGLPLRAAEQVTIRVARCSCQIITAPALMLHPRHCILHSPFGFPGQPHGHNSHPGQKSSRIKIFKGTWHRATTLPAPP